MRTSFHKRTRSGFSLIEMLVVIALIALIGTLTITVVGNILENNKKKIAGIFVKDTVKLPLTSYRMDVGSFPTEQDGGLMALLTEPKGKSGKWNGPYVEELPEDPWGNPYQYKFPGDKKPDSYDLWSTGPDLSDPGDDIGNWKE